MKLGENKMMTSKRITNKYTLIYFLIILGLFLVITPISAENIVLIKDKGLKNAIEKTLNLTPISLESLESIIELDASNLAIKDLNGIEHLKNLRRLNLSGNQIKDISKLGLLKQLSHLNIEKNQIESIDILKTNVNLASIFLRGNPLPLEAMNQIVIWKNHSIPVLYDSLPINTTKPQVIINQDRIALVKEPIIINHKMFIGLREITNYLNIELLLKEGVIYLSKGNISKTLDLKDYANNSSLDLSSSKIALMRDYTTYINAEWLSSVFNIGFRQNDNLMYLDFKIIDNDPLFKIEKLNSYGDLKSGNQGGYLNSKGEIVLPFLYSYEYEFTNGAAAVYYHNEWNIINKKGDIISNNLKYYIYKFPEGLGLVSEPFSGGKYGYVNLSGEIEIPFQFDYALPFSDGMAVVQVNGKFGYIDKSGTMVLEPQFKRAYSFSNGLAAVYTQDNKYNIIDKTGKVVGNSYYAFTDGVIESGLLRVVSYPIPNNYYVEKNGFVDIKGNIVIPLNYNRSESFSNGLALVTNDKGYYLIDPEGKVILELEQNMIGSYWYAEDLLPVQVHGKVGYINKNGQMIISAQFDDALPFDHGLAYVQINGDEKLNIKDKNGYIDKQGNFVYGPVEVFLSSKAIRN